ncbi:MAG: vWA domain-containing protein, partial [Planctomycetaceae bacterium]
MSTTQIAPKTHAEPQGRDQEPYEPGLLEGLLSGMPAWAISLCVHLIILLALASISIAVQQVQDSTLTTFIDEEEVRPEEYKFSSTVVDAVGNESDTNIAGPSLAAAQNVGADNHREREQRLEETALQPEIPIVESMPTPNEADLVKQFDAVGSTEHTGGTEGAMDRITMEIAASLRERQTLVVWLFDESLSVHKRRDEIADRFENVYRQLGLMDVNSKNALKTAVASFGRNYTLLTKEPTTDVETVAKEVRKIPADKSGVENVFAAVNNVYKKFLPWRRKKGQIHNVMVIVVTDERGDDYQQLETIIRNMARNSMRVYCVGNAAVFGREKGLIEHTWEFEGEEITRRLPADQGPETVAAERLQLPFWAGDRGNLSQMSSGYGPYALTRLCTETGGMYLVAEESLGRHFDQNIMRDYTPDYRPISRYQKQLATNKAKGALNKAAQMTQVDAIPQPQRVFLATSDTVLRQQITEAQKPLADLVYKLQKLQSTISSGEKDRSKLDTPRWRASYDLAMGRILAMMVRAHGYNSVLADMKSSPKSFEKDGSNQWRLKPSDEILGGPTVRKLHKQAMKYLTRVVDEHAGTPWALIAEVELSEPMGWGWYETKIQIAANNNMANNRNRPQFAPEEERRRQQ